MEEEYNSYIVEKNIEKVIDTYKKHRKLTISHWNIFSFSFSYCVIYPIFHFSLHNKLSKYYIIPMALITSMQIVKYNQKYLCKTFNYKDYEKFKNYCLKYGIYDDLL